MLLVAVSSLSPYSALVAANKPAFPTLPTRAIDTYSVSNYQESVEMMKMSRIRLKGQADIKLDPLPSHKWVPGSPNVSACFQIPLAPSFKIQFISFPQSDFPHPLNVETLSAYLEGLKLEYEQQKIEILEYPENSTGRSKFRVLGERALTLRYSLDQEKQRITHGENWVQYGDMIHIVIIEAPSGHFDRYYKDVRGYLNSMSLFQATQ
ncbi:MAG: hypothetical protein ACI8Z5_001576 [Lentimonas sp.]|jgi:hypothetical protein